MKIKIKDKVFVFAGGRVVSHLFGNYSAKIIYLFQYLCFIIVLKKEKKNY